MDAVKHKSTELGNSLLEASCVGDFTTVATLLALHVNINFTNKVNGWTALHWACKRGHTDIVILLLSHGADLNIKSVAGQKPSDVTNSESILLLLGVKVSEDVKQSNSIMQKEEFIPNYIKYPPLNPTVEIPLKIAQGSTSKFKLNSK